MEGWIKLHRQIVDHWIWKDPIKFKWWIDMLLMANHADTKVNIGLELYECKRGQSVLSLKSWGERWGVSKDTVRNFFVLLSKDNMIICENLQKSTRITICNYGTYQGDLHERQTTAERLPNGRQTQSHPNKNDKNKEEQINNEKQEGESYSLQISKRFLIPVSEIEEYLKSDVKWMEVVCMQNHFLVCDLEAKVTEFTEVLKARGENEKSINDVKSHFVNWLNKTKDTAKNDSKGRKSYLAAEASSISSRNKRNLNPSIDHSSEQL